jgi:hypothetical protein
LPSGAAPAMAAPLRAGAAYFAAVFAVGFVLGTVRTLALHFVPDISRFAAVLIEVPILLAAAWRICASLIHRLRISSQWTDRAIMGGSAFALLIIAETGLDAVLAGKNLAQHFALYREPSHAVGLAAQIVFAAIPLLQRHRATPVPGDLRPP